MAARGGGPDHRIQCASSAVMQWLWKDGRLNWPLVVLLAFSALWLVAFDYAWRLIEVQFEILLVVGLILWAVGALTILWVGWRTG